MNAGGYDINEPNSKSNSRLGHLARFALPALLAALAILCFSPQSAFAGGVVGDGTPGSCTEAALDTALAGGGRVTFYCGNDPVTIILSSEKVIESNTTIDGGERVTLDGNDTVRLFYVNASVALTLTNLTISGGNGSSILFSGYGGGVFNNGALTVINSTIADNNAVNDGGGIYSTSSPLSVMSSTFSNNTAHAGGGIEVVDSEANVSNSTFYGNSANHGGGIDVFLFMDIPTLNVFNSTFSGNSASADGGGIRNNGGTITLKNTIVANSSGANCSGTIIDGGSNLQYGGSTADSCGDSIDPGDPKLGTLADNGGPTFTLALLSGSAARNAANNATCAAAPVNDLDQRGSPRSVVSQCDIGAFEYDAAQAGPVFTVNDTGPIDDGVCGVGNCRLREAINAANLHAGADTIELSPGATYTLTKVDNYHDLFGTWSTGNGLPVIASDITINAHGSTIARSQAAGTPAFRHFLVPIGGILRLNGATLRGGIVTDFVGGSIYVYGGSLIAADSTFSNNATYYAGGGIVNDGAVTVIRSTFADNSANNGGGIENAGWLTVTCSTFYGNHAVDMGGGIENYENMVVVNSTLYDNSAAKTGGAILNGIGSVLTVINSTISGNSDSFCSGGICNESTATIKNTILANNGVANCNGDPVTDGGGNLQYGGNTPNSCGASIPTGDPKLGPLADNGGSTWTMALGLGSAASDAANNATCANPLVNNLDQRGVSRPVGDHCDAGAYETAFPHGAFLPLIRRK